MKCYLIRLAVVMAVAGLTAARAQEPARTRPSAQPVFEVPQMPDGVVLERDVQFGQAGEHPLLLDIVRPKADSAKPRPVVLFIHGGGWAGGDKLSAVGPLVPLAASGEYFCATANYRLTGIAPWPAQLHDCKAAIRWLKANAGKYNIDPDKIGVWGHSAGGHLVSMLGVTGRRADLEGGSGSPGHSSQVACVVDFAGPSDMVTFATKMKAGTPHGSLAKLFGEPADRWKEVARQASPVTYAAGDSPPFLIVHGTADNLVPLSQAEVLYEALKKAGADATLIKMVDGGHGIGGPEITGRVRAFFDKHLRGRKVDISAAPIQVPPAPAKKVAR